MRGIDEIFLWIIAASVIAFLAVCYKQQTDLTVMRIEAINRGYAEWVLKDGHMEFHWIK